MNRLAVAALVLAAATGCSSTSTTSSTSAAPAITSSSAAASGAASPTPSARVSNEVTPSHDSKNAAESLGEDLGAQIAFYAVAKAAGMEDSAKLDQLADGVCSRIETGKQQTVGTWLEDSFQLSGDVAAKVALAAIAFQCPEFSLRVGS